MNNKFFILNKYFSGVNDYINARISINPRIQTHKMAEKKEKREKREEKRDGFQPFYPYPGPWNNFGFPYGYGPLSPHPSWYPCSNVMVMEED